MRAVHFVGPSSKVSTTCRSGTLDAGLLGSGRVHDRAARRERWRGTAPVPGADAGACALSPTCPLVRPETSEEDEHADQQQTTSTAQCARGLLGFRRAIGG